jgi:hypothetical protein
VATTIPIPLTTVSQATTAGPAVVPAGVSTVRLTVNRNVGATPMDLQLDTSTTLVEVEVDTSPDGTNWTQSIDAKIPGGKIIPTRGPNAGVEQLTSGVFATGLVPGQQARAVITPSATFTTSGSLVLS